MGTAITEAKDQFSFNPFMARLKTRFSVGLTPEKSGQMGIPRTPARPRITIAAASRVL